MKTLSQYTIKRIMSETKRVTIQDIAKRADVSISTVSRVLNNSAAVGEAHRQAVEEAVAALDYRPNIFAKGLAGGVSMTIGILTQNISSPLYDAILYHVLQGIRDSGYSAIIADGQWHPDESRQSLQSLLERQVDGVIIIGGNNEEAHLIELAGAMPMVFVGRHIEGYEHLCICIDEYTGGYMATQHLLDRGHRQIAHIMGIATHPDAIARRHGYECALRDASIEPQAAWVVEGQFTQSSGVLAMEMLLTQGQTFSAVFAANDQMAYGARLALFRRHIRVPDDISIIGYDDQPHSGFTIPPLTTMRQPTDVIGRTATAAILDLLKGNPVATKPLTVDLIVRESVGRIYR